MIGLVVGLVRFIWESVYGQTPCGEETDAPDIITKVHYLHFGILLFGIVFIVCAVVSEGYNRYNPDYVEEDGSLLDSMFIITFEPGRVEMSPLSF